MDIAQKIVMGSMILGLVAYILMDIFVAVKYGSKDTISVIVRKAVHEYPIIAFALGVLIDHFCGKGF